MPSEIEDLGQSGSKPRGGFLSRYGFVDKAPLTFGMGCLFGLSSPGFDVWWLAWIGLVPLLIVLQSCQGRQSAHKEAFGLGLLFGLGYYMVALRWFLGLYPLSWLGLSDSIGFSLAALAWLLESLHQSLLFGAFAFFVVALPMRSGFAGHFERPYFSYLLSVPIIWVFFQWIISPSEGFLGVPVAQLAYSQAQRIDLIQVAKLGGSQLVDFLIVLTNAAVASLILEKSRLSPRLVERADRLSPRYGPFVDLALVVLLIFVSCLWGHDQLAQSWLVSPENAAQFAPPVPVAVLQGNITIEDSRLGIKTEKDLNDAYLSLGRNLGADILVLPEGAVDQSQSQPSLLLEALSTITKQEKKEAIFGTICNWHKGVANACELLSCGRLEDGAYLKRRLVPFGEYLPEFAATLALPFRHLLLGVEHPFIAASGLSLLRSVWGKVGSSICVETIYPHLIAEEVRGGASLLVNVCNLAWFHNSVLNRQILAAATLRACENQRYMILSTNTGISAVIDPNGVVTSQTYPGKKGILLDTVQFLYKLTPYTKMWWL